MSISLTNLTGSGVGIDFQPGISILALNSFSGKSISSLIDLSSSNPTPSDPTPEPTEPVEQPDQVEPDFDLNPLPVDQFPQFPLPTQPPLRTATRGPISLRTRGRAPYVQYTSKRTFNNKNGTFFPISGSF